MSEERLERIENLLTHLITMVGNTNERIGRLEERVDSIEMKLDRLETRVDNIEMKLDRLEEEQKSMRFEMLEKLQDMQADHNHIWEKAVKNERDLALLRSRLQL